MINEKTAKKYGLTILEAGDDDGCDYCDEPIHKGEKGYFDEAETNEFFCSAKCFKERQFNQ